MRRIIRGKPYICAIAMPHTWSLKIYLHIYVCASSLKLKSEEFEGLASEVTFKDVSGTSTRMKDCMGISKLHKHAVLRIVFSMQACLLIAASTFTTGVNYTQQLCHHALVNLCHCWYYNYRVAVLLTVLIHC